MRVYTGQEAVEYEVEYGQLNDHNELSVEEATEAGEKAFRAAAEAGEWLGVTQGYVRLAELTPGALAGLYEREEITCCSMSHRELVAHYGAEPWAAMAVEGTEGWEAGYEAALKGWAELCVSDGRLYTGSL